MAERIRGAKLVELPGDDHLPYVGDQDAILDEIQEFLTGVRHGPDADRVLATVLFTDIVGSTRRRPSSATGGGCSCSTLITTSYAMSSTGGAGARSPRQETAFSQRSTGQPGRSAVPVR